MNYTESVDLYQRGRNAWNDWATKLLEKREGREGQNSFDIQRWLHDAEVDFRGHDFVGNADFSRFIFPGKVFFERAKFLNEVDFQHASFEGSLNFSSVTFDGSCNLQFVEVKGEATFGKSRFGQPIDFSYSTFEKHFDLSQCSLHPRNSFCEAKFKGGITLEGNSLENHQFIRAVLPNSNLSACDLSGANFERADLSRCNLLGAQTDIQTVFRMATMNECKIDRYALDCLNDFGGLSNGAMMRMDIHDDTVVLRKSYSGLMRWVHVAAVLTFFFPYIWFALVRWSEAKFLVMDDGQSITLMTALARYVFNGGQGWERAFDFHWTFILFVFTLLYNVLRVVLLAKTKSLELHRELTGFAPVFSLKEVALSSRAITLTWNFLFKLSKCAMTLFLLVVALNAYHFLSMDVPIPSSNPR